MQLSEYLRIMRSGAAAYAAPLTIHEFRLRYLHSYYPTTLQYDKAGGTWMLTVIVGNGVLRFRAESAQRAIQNAYETLFPY